MSGRVERIVRKLVEQHAPHLTLSEQAWSGNPTLRIQVMARKLAHSGVMVLVGNLPAEHHKMQDLYIEDWTRTYAQMYNLLAGTLFPTHTAVHAFYADDHQPAVIVIEGQAAPVISVMAGYVSPYLTERQLQPINELELQGLMHTLLRELEAGDLPYHVCERVCSEGVRILKQMLHTHVIHKSLTPFDKPLLNQRQAHSTTASAPPPPPGVPEQDRTRRMVNLMTEENLTPSEQLFAQSIPLSRPDEQSTASAADDAPV